MAAFEHSGVDENVAQSGFGNAVDIGGHAFAAAEFGSDDRFSLVFGFDGEESGPSDVGIEEGKIGSPREHSAKHSTALFVVGHEVHVGTRDELHAAATGVDIDDDIAEGEEGGAEEVRDLAGDRAFGVSWERTIHVHAVEWREASGGASGGEVQGGDEDNATAHLAGFEFAREVHGRDLALVFVAMVATEH